MTLQQKVDRFWAWFQAGPGKWDPPVDGFDHERLNTLYDAIEADFPELTPRTNWMPGEYMELVLSIVQNRDEEARKSAVPIILALVKSAPKMEQWRVTAFAAKVGWVDAFLPRLDLPGDGTLKVAEMRFEILQREPLALRVHVPEYSEPKAWAFRIAVERVLEAGMGERWVLLDLARLEVADAKNAPGTARPIQELSSI